MAGEPPCFNLPAEPSVVYLGLGTNLGDRAGNLLAAIDRIRAVVRVNAVAPVYESPPFGYLDQPDFLNTVVRGSTELTVEALFREVKQIEREMGREATIRNGPRIIDIDILTYDERVIETAELTVPHPRMNDRAFVLLPLADIAPAYTDPRSGASLQSLIALLPESPAAVPLGSLEQLMK